jgi:hypothetical protein
MAKQFRLKIDVLALDDANEYQVEKVVNDLITRGKQDVIKQDGKDSTGVIISYPLTMEIKSGFPDMLLGKPVKKSVKKKAT